MILVDDGLATGATARALLPALRERARKLVVAVPLGTTAGADVITREVDELSCLHYPTPFMTVGTHYRVFQPREKP